MTKGYKLYAAYSFFLNRAAMADKCPTARLVGESEIKDHRLVFRGENAEALANVEPHKGGTVPVLLWEATPTDEAALDLFHGSLYRKEQVKVKLDGRVVNATVYLMNDELPPLAQPSAYYYTTIFNGYADAGFDEKIIQQSLADSITSVKDFIIQNSGSTFDMMTPCGYVYLTPEKAKALLEGSSVMGHPGHPEFGMEVKADELLAQIVQSANYKDGVWSLLTDCSKEDKPL